MNWDALAAVAELVAALVVVVTLIYLVTEIRENTKALRRSSADSALSHVLEFTGDLARDKGLERLFTRGIEDWAGVSEADRSRLAYVLYRLFKILENIHYNHLLGTLDEEAWVGWKKICLFYAESPAGQFYLDARRDWFSHRFLEMVESGGTPAQRVGTYSLAGIDQELESPSSDEREHG
jgi:hypothetical protein